MRSAWRSCRKPPTRSRCSSPPACLSGSAFLLVLAAFARLLPEHMRTLAYGMGTAAGSAGQFIFAPLGQGLIQSYGWPAAPLILAAIAPPVPIPSVFLLRE